MSGVATATADFVSIADKESRGKIRIACTRKTLPGLRYFEKRAVELGGGDTHRLRLDDAVLIKNNHLELAGSITESVRRLVEASGGIRKENLASYAKTGVDVISVGAITHSAPAVDMSLEIHASRK